MLNIILKIDPSASPLKAKQLAKVWDEVVISIVEEMLAIANPQMDDIHIVLREEMGLELGKLIVFISEKVVADRISGSTINEIDPQVEREQCFSLEGKERISNTAKNCADRVCLRRYTERWKLKTAAALRKEKKKEKGCYI